MRRWAALLLIAATPAATPAAAHPRAARLVPLLPAVLPAPPVGTIQITVDARPADKLASFSPQAALGVGVDGVPTPAVPEIYTPANVGKMRGAGLGVVSYRLYTELSVQDWHWNPAGRFSGALGMQGYWTSDATLGAATVDTFGYRLPRRGFTHDQGNDDDYSRLDDGDPATFWKSNPYLSSAYTGDADSAHPQWVLVDFGSAKAINAARIAWAAPYAVQYAVQYWTGGDPIYDPAHGAWVSFPGGVVGNGAGAVVTLNLGAAPHSIEYVRVLMTQSSGTCTAAGSADPRDCTGYAIGELGFGIRDAAGNFTDLVKHAPNRQQTVTYASSVDPWHSQANRVKGQEQPGLDIVFKSGITRGYPAMVPVPMMYSTPDNAAAELRYLQARGYRIGRVELGEEPDGQYVTPEDYAAFFTQFARALHAVDPKLQLGGPVFESNLTDVSAWPDAAGETSWTKRFVAYLQSHGQLADLTFFSFEHYPFGSCGTAAEQGNLLREPGLMASVMDVWRRDNLPAGLPIFITEANYSANETDAAQRPAGAIWYADMIGSLLSHGGAGAFFYEYEPIPLSPSNPCPGYGSYGVLLGNNNYRAGARLSQFAAAQILSSQWAQPGDLAHDLYPAQITGGAGYVGAYPVRRPDGQWSVLLVNRDLANAHGVKLAFGGAATALYLAVPVTQVSFGQAQYAWVEAGTKSHPSPDKPAMVAPVPGGAAAVYVLPAGSISVVRGTVPGL